MVPKYSSIKISNFCCNNYLFKIPWQEDPGGFMKTISTG
jgi:hypothetical protein